MKYLKYIIIFGLLSFSVAAAAPTTTISRFFQSTGLSGNGTLCVSVNNAGLFVTSSAACGSGSGSFTTTTFAMGATTLSATAYTLATGTATGIGLNVTGSGSTITYTPTISSGYAIPLSASTTNWESFYQTPSGRITAGNMLVWTGNILAVTTTPSFTTVNGVNPSTWITSETDPIYSANSYAVGMNQGVSSADSPAFLAVTTANVSSSGALTLDSATGQPIRIQPGAGERVNIYNTSGWNTILDTNPLTANRIFTFPNQEGVFVVGSTSTGALYVGNGTGFGTLTVGTNGKVLTASSSATNGVSWETVTGGSGITSWGGSTSSTQTYATGTDTNVQLTIGTANGIHTFTPIWAGTLADARITSAATWNAKITTTSLSVSGGLLTYNNTTGVFGNTANYVSSTAAGTGISVSGATGSVTITNTQPNVTSTIFAQGATSTGSIFIFATGTAYANGFNILSDGLKTLTFNFPGRINDINNLATTTARLIRANGTTWTAAQAALSTDVTGLLPIANETPGGADKQVNYNNGSLFAGDSNFTWSSSTQLLTLTSSTISGQLSIPNGTAPTVTRAGAIALDSSQNQLIAATNTTAMVYGRAVNRIWGLNVGSSSGVYTSSTSATTGFSPVGLDKDGYTLSYLACYTFGTVQGTTTMQVSDNTNHTNASICGVNVTTTTLTTNNSWNPWEKSLVRFGTSTAQPDWIHLEGWGYYTVQ